MTEKKNHCEVCGKQMDTEADCCSDECAEEWVDMYLSPPMSTVEMGEMIDLVARFGRDVEDVNPALSFVAESFAGMTAKLAIEATNDQEKDDIMNLTVEIMDRILASKWMKSLQIEDVTGMYPTNITEA